MNQLTKESAKELYPQWNEFNRLRKELDPNDLFLNSYLLRLFSDK